MGVDAMKTCAPGTSVRMRREENSAEKGSGRLPFKGGKGRKSRYRLACSSIKSRRDSPYPSTPISILRQLFRCIFKNTVGRVCDHGVY